MATQIKNYPIVESAINLFGDWLSHQKEMRDFARSTAATLRALRKTLALPPPNLIHSLVGARMPATNCRSF